MEKIKFSITIRAPKEKVWQSLWEDANYRKWTSAFAKGSHAVTDWKEGSKVLFLDDKGDGMFSTVEKNLPNEYMSIKHLGILKDGKEQTGTSWGNAHENYSLSERSGITTLDVEMDSTPDFKEYLEETWPKAFDLLQKLAES